MDQPQIDLWAIFLAAAVNVLIGSCWYSRWLFGDLWRKGLVTNQVNHSTCVNTDRGIFFFLPKYSVKTLLWVLASSFGTAFILGFFSVFLGVTTVSDGMFVGFLAWLGFTAPTQYSYVLWKKSSFKLFFIETGCSLLAYLSMGGIIGA